MPDPDQNLNDLIAAEWDFRLSEDPFTATFVGDARYNDRVPEVSLGAEARRAEQNSEFLGQLKAINPAGLSPRGKMNYVLFAAELEERLAQSAYGANLMPIAKLSGPHSFLPDMVLQTPFRSEQDYAAYLQRLSGMRGYLEGHIELMRAGVKKGLVQAKAALNGIEDSLGTLIVTDPRESVFYSPFQHFPPAISAEKQASLAHAGQAAIRTSVVPGFHALLDYLQGEYLTAARDEIGIAALPGGADYYAFLVKKFTTLAITPREVYETGLTEVARIRAEMEDAIRSAGFQGTRAEFIEFLHSDPRFYVTQPEALLKHVALIMKRMEGELPRLFKVLPRTPFGMRETPAHIAPRSTSAYYFPATGDGATAGYYYVNTYDLPSRPLYEYEALSFHEAVPGHHLQLALQQEMEAVPNFRRYSGIDAFIEGWALYAERLGLEVGFYQDPYSNFGRLIFEMWRACRLVVDPGIHCFGWSRQQAIDFMAENTALSLLNITNEVDRYIAWPGQAVAYKMGEITIRRLRREAEAALGPRFDLRDFHRVLLEDGAVPLWMVEEKIKAWQAAR